MSGRHRLALTGLLVGLAAVMVAWLWIDRRPPEWDHANHLERAVACHRSLAASGRDWLQEIIAESSFYPPIVTCAAGLLYFALPIVPLTAQAVIWAFLVVGRSPFSASGDGCSTPTRACSRPSCSRPRPSSCSCC